MKTKYIFINSIFVVICLLSTMAKAQSINTSLPVGTTSGAVNITQNGASTYEVPIQLTPGTGGMVPQLSIAYNSQGSDGLLGIGFSITGLSAISRCPSNYLNDGEVKQVKLDYSDKFTLDGNRLILISGTYGADGSEYRTENNTFVKVKVVGVANGGPEKFMVWTKSGLIQEYGYTSDSRIEAQGKTNVVYWLLDKVTDTKSNYYTITYQEDNTTGTYVPARIDYTGNDNSNPVLTTYNSVRFTYQTKSYRTPPLYMQGSVSRNTQLLKNVEVYNGSTLAKKYDLSYTLSSLSRYCLTMITETGSDGKNYNPVTIDWTKDESWGFQLKKYSPGSFWDNYNYVAADFKGNGLSGIMAVPDRNSGADMSHISIWDNSLTSCSAIWLSSTFIKALTGDFNGDGKTDIMVVNSDGSQIYLSTGSGFQLLCNDFLTSDHQFVLGDFDGDGKTEVLATDYKNASTPWDQWQIHQYTTSGFDRTYFTANTNTRDKDILMGDFNGDGISDLLIASSSNTEIYICSGINGTNFTKWGTISINKDYKFQLGDFNGDGKTDIFQYGYQNLAGSNGFIWNSDGTKFLTNRFNFNFDPTDCDLYLADFDGDGRSDCITVSKTQNISKIYLSGISGSDLFSFDQLNIGKGKFVAGSFSGKNKADFMIEGSGIMQIYHSNGGINELVKSITDGLGNTTKITYKSLCSNSNYLQYSDGEYPLIDINGAMAAVDSLILPNGIEGTKVTKYKYEGAKFHKLGRGFLGFSKVTTTDCQTGIYTTSFYEFETTQYVPGLKRTETRTSGDKLLSEANYTNTIQNYETGVFTYMPTSITENKYELNSGSSTPYNTTTTAYTYDNYGNVLTTSQDFGGEASVTTANVYVNDVNNWFLGRLTNASVVKKSANKPDITRLSQFEYDPANGLLTKEKIEPGNDTLGYEKVYEHDSYGNITKSTTTAGGKTRYLQSKYDGQGRFEIETSNKLSHKVTKTVHPLFGTITSQTSPDTISVTTEYDGFGKATKTTNPDGNFNKVALYWCDGTEGGPSNAVFYSKAESSENPPVLEFFDRLGRSVQKIVTGFDGKRIFAYTVYNMRGQVSVTSEPYFEGTTPTYTTYTYDDIGRLTRKLLPDKSTLTITYNGLTTTVQNPLSQTESRIINQRGLLVQSTDNNSKTITYVYNSAGNLLETHDPKGTVIKMEYDILGNRTKLIDPDLGTITSRYNAFGEQWQETDAKSQTVTTEYDDIGRIVKRTEPEGISQWVYDATFKGTGKLTSITGPNNISQSVQYDELGRVKTQSETIDGITYNTTTSYDSYSRVAQVTYPKDPANPNGFSVLHHYNQYGFLDKVVNASSGLEYWVAQKMNARGQFEQIKYGNNLTTNRTFNNVTGLLESIQTPGIRNWTYSFNTIGTLVQRKDVTRDLTENFEYDNLNRLVNVKKNGTESLALTYDEVGNILTKSDVGVYNYGSDGNNPHALQTISLYGSHIINPTMQNITYTSFDKVKTIWQGADSMVFTYGISYERKRVDTYKNQVLQSQKYYVGGLYEREKNIINGEIKETFYIIASGGAVAIFTHSSTGTDKTQYLHKDHLGSVQYITDENGNLAQELSYDAWGNRRDPATWKVYTTLPVGLLLARGFTGHEHLDLFGLVNMDGRVYDPSIGRFLSPDIIIQDIENLQCFNRYSYCVNNPLSLTDPSGYSWLSNNWKSLVAAVVAITVTVVTAGILAPASWAMVTTATVAGAAGGFAGGFTGALLAGGDLGDAFKAGAIGGLIGGASGFLSFAGGQVSSTGTMAIIERAAKHTFANAWLSGIQGENMAHGALSGLFSSLGGEITWKGEPLGVKIAANAIVGGTASYVGGGKFANGAITGAYVMMFNHMVNHYREKKYEFSGFKLNADPNKDTKLNGKTSAIYRGYVAIKQRDGKWYAEGFAEVIPVDAGDKPNFYGNIVVYRNGKMDSYDYLTMDKIKGDHLFDGNYTQIGIGGVWLPETGNVNVQITIGDWTWKFWTGSTSHLIYQHSYDPIKD